MVHQLYLYHELPQNVEAELVSAFDVKLFIDLSPKPRKSAVVESVAVLVHY